MYVKKNCMLTLKVLKDNIDYTVKNLIKINHYHQFKINYEGIRTKQYNEPNWSEWQGIGKLFFLTHKGPDVKEGSCIEPFSLLATLYIEKPSVLLIPELSASRIYKLSQTFGTEEKVNAVINEWTSLEE